MLSVTGVNAIRFGQKHGGMTEERIVGWLKKHGPGKFQAAETRSQHDSFVLKDGHKIHMPTPSNKAHQVNNVLLSRIAEKIGVTTNILREAIQEGRRITDVLRGHKHIEVKTDSHLKLSKQERKRLRKQRVQELMLQGQPVVLKDQKRAA